MQLDQLDQLHQRDDTIARGSFEACPEYRGLHHDGVCDGCGWLAADHEPAHLAEVIPVPIRRPQVLRRAS